MLRKSEFALEYDGGQFLVSRRHAVDPRFFIGTDTIPAGLRQIHFAAIQVF
jgi:hypothetical protein